MNRIGFVLVLINLAIGLTATGLVWQHHAARAADVARLRDLAEHERAETATMERSLARDEALRAGLRLNDPFVVELLARERLGWTRPGEVQLPPKPTTTVDKPTPRP